MNDIAVGIASLLHSVRFFSYRNRVWPMPWRSSDLRRSYLSRRFLRASNMLVKDFFDTFTSYGLTVIPIFVLMGQIAFFSGIAKKLYPSTYTFMGHVPGDLAMATVAATPL